MAALISEWLHLVVRWMHILAGVMWIGTSIFFNWMDSHLEKTEATKPGVEGELWMVHSGGFYQVEKKLVAPEKLPKTLHWFKWEAGFTWLTGAFLLALVYYMGGGVLLVDSHVSSIGAPAAIALCVALLVVSWFVYDLLWISPFAKVQPVCIAIMCAMIVGVAYGLTHVLSGRAAYMHVGAMMGTWMAWNVWVRIIPAQKALVASTKTGTKPDPELGKKAKQRSRHNNYMTYPVIFILLSNHFPSTYGSSFNWVILIAIFLVGVAARHFENTGDRSPAWVFGVLGVVALLADSKLTATPVEEEAAATEEQGPTAPSTGGPPAPPPDAGSIEGTVRFTGGPHARKTITIPRECAPEGKGAIFANDVLVKDGRVQNAFVWIKEGMGEWKGAPPSEEVVLDQHGCMYGPRVIGAEVGQRVTFVNSDPVLHNVRVVSDKNPTFNLNMAAKGMRLSKTFGSADVMLAAKCDVHPWMGGFVGVVPHPYYAVSGAAGDFTLKGVPPGDYVVEVWHEVYGRKTQKVAVAAKTTARADFSFP
jgi:uncharacterized membrane protein/plastocyanin